MTISYETISYCITAHLHKANCYSVIKISVYFCTDIFTFVLLLIIGMPINNLTLQDYLFHICLPKSFLNKPPTLIKNRRNERCPHAELFRIIQAFFTSLRKCSWFTDQTIGIYLWSVYEMHFWQNRTDVARGKVLSKYDDYYSLKQSYTFIVNVSF